MFHTMSVRSLRTLRPLPLAILTCLIGCAHQPTSAEEGVVDEPMEPEASHAARPIVPRGNLVAATPETCPSLLAHDRVKRSAVVDVVDKGLGVWLQGVRVRAQVHRGKFAGWRIESLHLTNPCYAQVDLHPGDVVTAINGSSVAREGAAFEVFSALRTAPAIEVAFVRAGAAKHLRFTITD